MTPEVSSQVKRLEALLAAVQMRAGEARPARTLFQRTGRIENEPVALTAPVGAPAARVEAPTAKFARPDAVVPAAPISGAVRKSLITEVAPVSSVAPASVAARAPEREVAARGPEKDVASARVPVPAASTVRSTMLGTAPAAAVPPPAASAAPAARAAVPAPVVAAAAGASGAVAARPTIATQATEVTRPQILDAPVANFKDAVVDSFGSAFDDALKL